MKLHLPGLTVDSLNFHINDYEVLTSSYGEKIDGIIGYSFFSRYIVKIDYDSSRIFVYSKGTMKYPRGGFLLRPFLINLPYYSTTLRDERKVFNRYYFDTGAGMCLLLSTTLLKTVILLDPKTKMVFNTGRGIGRKGADETGCDER